MSITSFNNVSSTLPSTTAITFSLANPVGPIPIDNVLSTLPSTTAMTFSLITFNPIPIKPFPVGGVAPSVPPTIGYPIG